MVSVPDSTPDKRYLILQSEAEVPIMNIVWFSPSIIGVIFLFSVRRSSPITPPSKSAELASKWHPDQRYLAQIKTVMAKAAFLLLLQFTGKS